MFEHEFALCLTHDVDRAYKTFQAPYYALKDRNPSHLKPLVSTDCPYWQFEEIMELEEELGVRSSFYFLNEKNLLRDKEPREWTKPNNWKLFTGRYDITDDEIIDVIQTLDRGGWEVGLHGLYKSDHERLQYEKGTPNGISQRCEYDLNGLKMMYYKVQEMNRAVDITSNQSQINI